MIVSPPFRFDSIWFADKFVEKEFHKRNEFKINFKIRKTITRKPFIKILYYTLKAISPKTLKYSLEKVIRQ